jgi:type VI secretion system protein ImpG
VLERYLARHAAINSFVTTRLLSSRRGEIMAWPPRCGTGALL